MRRILATVLSVVMLLSFAAALPVSADTLPLTVSLPIQNADFEADEIGSKTITGWTPNYDPADTEAVPKPWYIAQFGATKGLTIDSNVKDGVGNGGDKKISQVVTIPESMRANIADYDWYWESTNVYCTYLWLQLTDAEGNTSTEAAFDDFAVRNGTTHTSKLTITGGMTSLANPVSVKVTIGAHGNGGAWHDNIKIYGIKKGADLDETSLISNSDLWKQNNGAISDWTLGLSNATQPVNSGGVGALVSWVEKDDGSGDYYVITLPEYGEEGTEEKEGKRTGATGSLSRNNVYVPDAAAYLLTVRYKAVNNTDARVKISDINDGWKVHLDYNLPATSTATTLEEAEWGTYKKILYMSDIADDAQSQLEVVAQAHPNTSVVGAWYDYITLEPVSGVGTSNYIANGDFEMDTAGATDILGWTQLSSSAHVAVVGENASSGNNYAGSANNGGLQTYVPVQATMKGNDKALFLSFNSMYSGGDAMPAVEVIANRSTDNGGNVSYTYTSFMVMSESETRGSDAQSYTDGLSWEYKELNAWAAEDYEIDLSNLIELAGGLDKITGFTINLKNSNTAGAWDNVKLYMVDKAIVKNGSFETDEIDSTTITNWEQVGHYGAMYSISGQQTTYLVPFADGGTKLAYSKTGVSALKQTVVLDQTKEYYTDQDNYEFKISGTAYAPGATFASRVTIVAYNAEGDSKAYSWNMKYDTPVTTNWTMNPFEFDFSHVMDAVDGTVTKFDVILGTRAGGGESAWDGIKVTPVYNPDRLKSYALDIENAFFEADAVGTTGSSITGWTPVDEATSTWIVRDVNGSALVPTSGKFLHAPKTAEGKATSAITQTVEIPVDADYFANMDKYDWKLSFSGHYITYVNITAYNSDKSLTATASYSTFDRRADWTMNSMDFNITDTLLKVGKARYLELTLAAHGASDAAIDDILIWATQKPEVAEENLLKNPGFEEKTEEGALAEWTAEAPAEGTYEYIYDAAQAPSGFGFVKLGSVDTDESEEGTNYVNGAIKQSVELAEGYYVLDFSYLAADKSAVAEVIDPDSGEKLVSMPFMTSGGAYAVRKITFKAPETKSYEIRLACFDGSAGVSFENIKLKSFTFDESVLVTEGNKIVNGGFEQDYTDTVKPIGWDAEVTAGDPSRVIVDSRGSYGSKLLMLKGARVSQTVEIPEYNATAGENYGYKFGFAYGSWNGGSISISFDLTFADERENITQKFDSVRVNADGMVPVGDTDFRDPDLSKEFPYHVLNATAENIEIDLTFLTQKTKSPLTSIKVTLLETNVTEAYLDNFSLVCTAESPEMRPEGEWTYTFYDEDGETVLKTVTGGYGTPVIAPENPIKEGTEEMIYVFTGWGEDYSDDLMLTDANYTFTASYQGYGKTEVSEDGTTFTVGKVVYGAPEGSTVVLAIYRNGRMIDVQQQAYTGAAPVFTFTNTNYDEAKVMVWSKLGALKPIVTPELVDLSGLE